jgi:hypothetical protein
MCMAPYGSLNLVESHYNVKHSSFISLSALHLSTMRHSSNIGTIHNNENVETANREWLRFYCEGILKLVPRWDYVRQCATGLRWEKMIHQYNKSATFNNVINSNLNYTMQVNLPIDCPSHIVINLEWLTHIPLLSAVGSHNDRFIHEVRA